MTTIIGLVGKDFVLIAGDTRTSQGNLKLPFPTSKTEIVSENILVSGSGSVGNLQMVLKFALRNARLEKAYYSDSKIELEDLTKALSELNFTLPLEYKHYSPYAFLIGGLNSEAIPTLFSIGDDGSSIEIPSFYSLGSGSQLALSILAKGWNKDISLIEAKTLAVESLKGSSDHDLYTNDDVEIFVLQMEEDRWRLEKLKQLTPEEIEKAKENIDKGKDKVKEE